MASCRARAPRGRRAAWRLPLLVPLLALLLAACSGPDRRVATSTLPPVPTGTPTHTIAPAPSATGVGATATATIPPGPGASPPAPTPTPSAPTATTATGVPPVPTPTPPPAPASVFDPTALTLGVEQVGARFTNPLLVTHAGDGSGRIFVVEKVGTIRLLDGTLFLDIRERVVSPAVPSYEQEQGLLGVAFHPRFAENGYLYLHYNDRNGNHVLSRFSLGPDGLADPASEKVLLTQEQPEVNFNGGAVVFGPDGYLYLGLGTGGTAVELQHNAQDLGSLLGKILRIDVDNGDPYAIPPDNPFVGTPGARPEVWAYGLRNPYRFAFDPATGDLYIGGPGQFTWEWINYHPAEGLGGQNYGWPMFEGRECWSEWVGPCDPAGLDLPIIVRPTYGDGNCVIIGGHVYRGAAFPLLQGAYLYGDFCSGRIWAAARDATGAWATTEMLRLDGAMIGSFGEDEGGELYVTDIVGGVIYRIVATPRP